MGNNLSIWCKTIPKRWYLVLWHMEWLAAIGSDTGTFYKRGYGEGKCSIQGWSYPTVRVCSYTPWDFENHITILLEVGLEHSKYCKLHQSCTKFEHVYPLSCVFESELFTFCCRKSFLPGRWLRLCQYFLIPFQCISFSLIHYLIINIYY